ncbi:MAG: flagella basal body P-ring formation protein FlgA [Candidatus Riflebacteria bacterium]|nr:flagella basal body P-ring formation protein FlgA [Candidatus Riflebacteria bacterium]
MKLSTKNQIFLLLICFLLPSFLKASTIQGRILIKPDAVVEVSHVDMASLFGKTLPEKLHEPLSKIWIGNISKPLGEIVVEKSELERRLGPLVEFFEIPERVRIRRNGDIISADEIKSQITKVIEKNNCENGEGDLSIDFSAIGNSMVLPGKLKNWRIEQMSTNNLGLILFSLTAETLGGTFNRIMQVEAVREIEAAKVKRLIKKGQLVRSMDVDKKIVKIKTQSSQMPISYAKVIGQKLGLYKSPGSFIRESDLDQNATSDQVEAVEESEKKITKGHPEKKMASVPQVRKDKDNSWMIKPGQEVSFNVTNGNLSLTVPAKALEGGEMGDSIKLVNLKNNRQIQGKIVGKGLVENVD